MLDRCLIIKMSHCSGYQIGFTFIWSKMGYYIGIYAIFCNPLDPGDMTITSWEKSGLRGR